jgi:hypothetical protein
MITQAADEDQEQPVREQRASTTQTLKWDMERV